MKRRTEQERADKTRHLLAELQRQELYDGALLAAENATLGGDGWTWEEVAAGDRARSVVDARRAVVRFVAHARPRWSRDELAARLGFERGTVAAALATRRPVFVFVRAASAGELVPCETPRGGVPGFAIWQGGGCRDRTRGSIGRCAAYRPAAPSRYGAP